MSAVRITLDYGGSSTRVLAEAHELNLNADVVEATVFGDVMRRYFDLGTQVHAVVRGQVENIERTAFDPDEELQLRTEVNLTRRKLGIDPRAPLGDVSSAIVSLLETSEQMRVLRQAIRPKKGKKKHKKHRGITYG